MKKALAILLTLIFAFSCFSVLGTGMVFAETAQPPYISVVDTEGNPHKYGADIGAKVNVTPNADGSNTFTLIYDDMDKVNAFMGWYDGETFLSPDLTYTADATVNKDNVKAKILCRSVISGGLGFESYKTSTSLRVDPKQSGTPPYNDRWGIWSNFTTDSTNSAPGYENIDWDFDIKTTVGDTTVKYAPTYDTSTSAFTVSQTVIKPYSGKSMFYFAARSRSVVRKLDNLKPNTEYELSFYTYNLSKWDFLSKVTVADTYDMKTGITSSNSTVKVYASYKEALEENTIGYNEIADTFKILRWNKISLKFTTDEDDTKLYLHLCTETGNNSSSTSKQFIDNLTVTEVRPPETFNDAVEFIGASIRKGDKNTPQALRFKFEISNYITNLYDNGYSLKEYGALVAYNQTLSGSELNFDTSAKYYKGVAYNKEDGTNKVFATTDTGSIVSFALYNIGVINKTIDYSVYNQAIVARPYSIYVDENGNEHIYYANSESISLFDVIDAILSKSTLENVKPSELTSYLSDVITVRNIIDSKAYDAYVAAGRTTYTKNDSLGSVTLTDLGEKLPIHTELQSAYLSGYYNNISEHAGGTAELSRSKAITFSWTDTNFANGTLYGYLLTLSENSDLSNGDVYAININLVDLYNLKIGTTYYWSVTAIYSDGVVISDVDTFSTEATAPRNLYISGVTNARDIGGWTINGKQTNQGLIFRMGHLDSVTLKGQTTLFNELGIKSEIDIRMESEARNVFGDKLKYYAFYMGYSGGIITSNHESIVKFFEVLGDESNYPIVYHCSIGTDRTGMMSFLLNGLLGATEEQLYKDYLFSNFGNIGSNRTPETITYYLSVVNECKGTTLSKRIYNYLLNIGVKSEHMDTFIRIMTK
ncbi:MAG: tyrosine-protein phosphatase [Clostridia bacterium]|nr:tyrosine-protein phosphatase [Clostridia bacterium]